MTDIIWGNVGRIISESIFELNVTHRNDNNKDDYSDVEKIKFTEVDISSIPANAAERTTQVIEEYLGSKFVKCEIEKREADGYLVAKVSHSGQGGY